MSTQQRFSDVTVSGTEGVNLPIALTEALQRSGDNRETYDPSWASLIVRESGKPYWQDLRHTVQADRLQGPVYPPRGMVLAALRTPLQAVRVVILGQDPYHGPGQAHGFAFSVPGGVKPPPSLRNVINELVEDIAQTPHDRLNDEAVIRAYSKRRWALQPDIHSGNLTPWTQRGVLLLNTVLTVRGGMPKSHAGVGWVTFTDAVCRKVLEQDRAVVWLLWGSDARHKVSRLIGQPLSVDSAAVRERHLFLTAGHPSPLNTSVPYRGCRHFSQANDWLREHGAEPVDWSL